MKDNHITCRKDLKTIRKTCEKYKIPIICYSKKRGNFMFDVFINGRGRRVSACCGCSARKKAIEKEFDEKSKFVLVSVGNDTFLTTIAGKEYINYYAKNNKPIHWTKIVKIYDEEIIDRLKHEKLNRDFYDAYGDHAKKRQIELAKKWDENNR